MHPSIQKLLSYATSESSIADEYKLYLSLDNRKLLAIDGNGKFAGCIGIKILKVDECEIKHIAVDPTERDKGLGTYMINFVCEKYNFKKITAETDFEAVNFYRNYGFTVSSLGEKYPGIERFKCEYYSGNR